MDYDLTVKDVFLSTPSARRATILSKNAPSINENFYPRPPRGGRQAALELSVAALFQISIHALREEGDEVSVVPVQRARGFLSTPSARRATCYLPESVLRRFDFYPRPPRGGRRQPDFIRCSRRHNFYPRPPRGGRQKAKGEE